MAVSWVYGICTRINTGMFVNFGVILNDMIDLRLNQYVLIRKRTFIKTNWFTVHVSCNIHVHANHSSIFNRFGYIHANLSDLVLKKTKYMYILNLYFNQFCNMVKRNIFIHPGITNSMGICIILI